MNTSEYAEAVALTGFDSTADMRAALGRMQARDRQQIEDHAVEMARRTLARDHTVAQLAAQDPSFPEHLAAARQRLGLT